MEKTERRALVAADPVELVHRYRDPHDQEVAGLVVAALAYGRVVSIREAAGRVLAPLDPHPARAIADGRGDALSGFVYRFQKGEDMPDFLRAIARVRRAEGSLGAAFASADQAQEPDYAETASRFVARLRHEMPAPLSYGLRYLLPDPGTGGASKRLWLYLRWMLRPADGLDLGTWRHLAPELSPARLLVPLDTHMARVSRYLRFTERAANDLRTAREITAALAQVEPEDPVRYDMALCHHGISGACPRELDLKKCAVCPLVSVCGRG